MKCVILAAGYATRLYPLTENFPKPLLKVGGKSILDWLTDDIESAKCADEYIVVSNHRYAQAFRDWAEGKSFPVTVLDDGTETNETRLGAVKDIELAIEKLGLDEDLLVIAGDNLLNFSLRGFIEYAHGKKTSCIMRFYQQDREKLKKTGVAEVDENDLVTRMEEKPREPKGNWCTPPFYFYIKDDVKLVIDATPGYESCDRQRIIEQNEKSTVRHAYFREYRALQKLCLLILRHQKHQIGSGSRKIYGILFDGAWLWEEYVNSLIEDVFYHPMNKGGKGAQRLFDGNVGLIYPDFISRNNESRIIADAKYKPIDNIGNKDYLQVLAYMFRFDAKVGCYLYPEAEGSDDLRLRMNRGSTYESNVTPREDISITKHGLKIPVDAADYAEFVAKMKEHEQEFVSAFSA